MNHKASTPPALRGTWLVDSVLAVALLALCAAIVAPSWGAAKRREQIRRACTEARDMHEGFQRYFERNRMFPSAREAAAQGTTVLDTLRRRGYFDSETGDVLTHATIDAYDAPSGSGGGAEYWLELTLTSDASIRLLVARSDDAPMGRGHWMDGAFLYRDGKLERL